MLKKIQKKKKSHNWIWKSVFTIVVSQIGILIALFLIGPSSIATELNHTSSDYWEGFIKDLKNYIIQGSLLLSTISIASNLVSLYIFDERKEDSILLFERSKVGIVTLIVIIFISGITYAIIPSNFTFYFLILQIGVFLCVCFWVIRINYIVQDMNTTYKEEFDRKSEALKDEEITKDDGIEY